MVTVTEDTAKNITFTTANTDPTNAASIVIVTAPTKVVVFACVVVVLLFS